MATGLFGDPVDEDGADLAFADWRGKANFGLARVAVEIGCHEKGLAREWVGGVEDRALAAREEIARLIAGTALADAVGIGEGHHFGKVHRGPLRQAHLEPLGLGFHPFLRGMADRSRPIVAARQSIQAQSKVGGRSGEKITLAQKRRHGRGGFAGLQEHMP